MIYQQTVDRFTLIKFYDSKRGVLELKTLKYKKLKKPTPQCHLGPMNITEVN